MKLVGAIFFILHSLFWEFTTAVPVEALCITSELTSLLVALGLPNQQVPHVITGVQNGICKANVTLEPVQRATAACYIAQYVLSVVNVSTSIPLFIQPSSPVYTDRVDVNW